MLLKVMHKLAELGDGRFVCDPEEVQDLDDCIGALQRAASRIDEDVAPFLPPKKREYVFEGMAAAAAHYIMWMLPEMKVTSAARQIALCSETTSPVPMVSYNSLSTLSTVAERLLGRLRRFVSYITAVCQVLRIT